MEGRYVAALLRGDRPPRAVSDVYPPQLVVASLVHGVGLDGDPPRDEGAQEMCRVSQADGDLPLLTDCTAGPNAGCALDGSGVDPAVHDPPWGVVILAEVDVSDDTGVANLVQHEPSVGHECAGRVERHGCRPMLPVQLRSAAQNRARLFGAQR